MLSILIQLNPGYLSGIMEEDSLVLQSRGVTEGVGKVQASSKIDCGTGRKISECPGGRRMGGGRDSGLRRQCFSLGMRTEIQVEGVRALALLQTAGEALGESSKAWPSTLKLKIDFG